MFLPGITGRNHRLRSRIRLAVVLLVLASAALTASGCGGTEGKQGAGQETPHWSPDRSWELDPVVVDGTSFTAQVIEGRYQVHTVDGDVTFLAGVNLGATVPGRLPGEMALTAEDYRRWFPQMVALGFRVVRIYTIHPPAFYDELAAYNRAHPRTPLYLAQGVYLNDSSYVETGDLFDRDVTDVFTAEVRDAVGAVFGDLTRETTPGHASGRWTTSVAPWVVGWIIGSELDPEAVLSTDRSHRGEVTAEGEYVTATSSATATEKWFAARLDELAGQLTARDSGAPLAFINWITTDPLSHPEEPLEDEDLVPVDANHMRATSAWPAGLFASYHAYPYYPDFLRTEPGIRVERAGKVDPYYGYLRQLVDYHAQAGIPVMITEFGVPSSVGDAHRGMLGRDQGWHDESGQMATDADLLDVIREAGAGGGYLFEWTDEWWKSTWNVMVRHLPADRRQLWHDVLSPEEYYGIVATDPVVADRTMTSLGTAAGVEVSFRVTPSWVYLTLRGEGVDRERIGIGLDVLDGGAAALPGSAEADGASDVAVVIDASADTARAYIREDQDPVQLDFSGAMPETWSERCAQGWCLQGLSQNGVYEGIPAEYQAVGELREGPWDPAAAGADSRNTWQVSGGEIRLRLPWGLLAVSDPSSGTACRIVDRVCTEHRVDGIGIRIRTPGGSGEVSPLTWDSWQKVDYVERLKPGWQALAEAVARADAQPRRARAA
jgi:hypothetical protein